MRPSPLLIVSGWLQNDRTRRMSLLVSRGVVWTHGGVEGLSFLVFVVVPISLAPESLGYD